MSGPAAERFVLVQDLGEPDALMLCCKCQFQFFVSPHTEEGLYLKRDDDGHAELRIECPACGERDS